MVADAGLRQLSNGVFTPLRWANQWRNAQHCSRARKSIPSLLDHDRKVHVQSNNQGGIQETSTAAIETRCWLCQRHAERPVRQVAASLNRQVFCQR